MTVTRKSEKSQAKFASILDAVTRAEERRMHSEGHQGVLTLRSSRSPAVAAERARWLDELTTAVGDAQLLTWRLGVAEGDSEEARSLYARLEAIRAEIEWLRIGWAGVRKEIDPKWMI